MTFVSVTSGGSGSLGEADTPHTAHAREPQLCSLEIGNKGSVACEHLRSGGGYPYKPNY